MSAYVPGQELPGATMAMTPDQVSRYAEASGDHNPIHLDDAAAVRGGLPGRIAHGMLTMGLLGTVASGWAGDAERIVSLGCRFRRPVLVGDVLSVSGRIVKVGGGRVTAEAEIVNQHGEAVLGHASVVFTEPDDKESA